MQLIGMMDSPFVRRVAITLNFMKLAYHHHPLSVFNDMHAFAELSPLIKAPSLLLDDGQVLLDSNLIIEYLESISAISLRPETQELAAAMTAVVGQAMVVNEKAVQVYYEHNLRAADQRSEDWLERISHQLKAAMHLLDQRLSQNPQVLIGKDITQADISVTVAWSFTQLVAPEIIKVDAYPHVARFAAQMEKLPEFVASPIPN